MPTLLERAVAAGEIDAEIIHPGSPTPTVTAAATALGVPEERILKSLLFLAPDGQAVLAVAAGPGRVNRDLLAAAAGAPRLKFAPPDEVLRRTGYPVGGAPPVCHATPLQVIVDRRLLDFDVVYGGGGTDDSMLRIAPAEILRVTGASVADIVDPAHA